MPKKLIPALVLSLAATACASAQSEPNNLDPSDPADRAGTAEANVATQQHCATPRSRTCFGADYKSSSASKPIVLADASGAMNKNCNSLSRACSGSPTKAVPRVASRDGDCNPRSRACSGTDHPEYAPGSDRIDDLFATMGHQTKVTKGSVDQDVDDAAVATAEDDDTPTRTVPFQFL